MLQQLGPPPRNNIDLTGPSWQDWFFKLWKAQSLAGYTVATLPNGIQGDRAFVTDALAPTYLAIVIGGGTTVVKVFYNGTNWVCT